VSVLALLTCCQPALFNLMPKTAWSFLVPEPKAQTRLRVLRQSCPVPPLRPCKQQKTAFSPAGSQSSLIAFCKLKTKPLRPPNITKPCPNAKVGTSSSTNAAPMMKQRYWAPTWLFKKSTVWLLWRRNPEYLAIAPRKTTATTFLTFACSGRPTDIHHILMWAHVRYLKNKRKEVKSSFTTKHS
jgi:hypothetical protein